MDAEYGKRYRDLYERHWWWRAREAALIETLKRLKPSSGWPRILDVGCGDGLFFDQLLAFGHVEGVEPSGNLVDPAGVHRQRIHVRPFDETFRPPKPFSLILMLDVLEHLEDPVGALRHATRLLSPGGTVLITVPAFNLLWTNHDVINQHRTRYTKASFRRLAEQAELFVDEEHYWFQWTAPVKMAERTVEILLRREAVPPRVPPRLINAALYKWSRFEHLLLQRLKPPFGSSLMVIGHGRAAN
jgi:SAM-dependent methyltransferase